MSPLSLLPSLVLLFLLSGQVCNTELSPTARRYLYNLEGKEGGKEGKRGEVKRREGGREDWGGGEGREEEEEKRNGMLVVLGTKTAQLTTSLHESGLLKKLFVEV